MPGLASDGNREVPESDGENMQHQHFNGLKTTLLFSAIIGLLLFCGAMVAGGRYIWVFALFGVGVTAYSYWNSDKIALKSMRARPVSEVEYPALYRIVRELATTARQPMPRLFVSPTAAPNAFATGRNPSQSAVCCTEGIMELLDERELRGVLGHELMHVYNRDILISSVAAALGGVITAVAQIGLFFGGGFADDEDRPNPVGLILMALAAPLAATIIQFAISRTREYDADQDGARLTGDPLALASALRKLAQGTAALPLPPERDLVSSSHLMIAYPFRAEGFAKWFSTHPPMSERIARLEAQAGYPR